jgi:hypothetical protein
VSAELRQRLRAHPWFFGTMGLLTVLALAAGAMLGREYLAWQRAGRSLEHKQHELAKLETLASAPSALELESARTALEQARSELLGVRADEVAAGTVPAGRIEAYADLNSFVGRTRARAAHAGVAVAAEERFGFEQYAREGPPLDRVPEVWRQRVMVEQLLEALWAVRPQVLAGVWCEAVAPDRSLQVPGLVEASGVRLAFVGRTACLRRYLARLAEMAPPVVVREVRVEPMPVDPRRQDVARATKFTLVLEALSAVGPVAVREPKAEEMGAAVWPEPRAQSAGADWIFEVFEPPALSYDKDRRVWTLVAGPVGASAGASAQPELVAVQRRPYRWRLVGSGASGTASWVLLEDARNLRTVRLGEGESDAAGEISVVETRMVRAVGGETVAEVRLRERAGAEVVLRSGVVTRGSELVALVRTADGASPVEVAADGVVTCGETSFRITAINEAPAAATLVRLGTEGPAAETLRIEAAAR